MILVKKFCDMVGVNYSTLRHYERIGLLNPYQNEDNGYRNYTPEDAFRVNVFKYYRSLGYDTKTAVRLVEEPEKEYVRKKLLELESTLMDEILHTRNRMKAVQRQLEDLSFMDAKAKYRIGVRKDLWFLPVSLGIDFEQAKYEEMAAWVKFLPLTRYAKHMKVSDSEEIRKDNVANYGMSIESMSAFLLSEESKKNAIFIPGGTCLYYYSSTLESPIREEILCEEIADYLREHNLKIYGDVYVEGLRIWDDFKQKGQIVSIPIEEEKSKI